MGYRYFFSNSPIHCSLSNQRSTGKFAKLEPAPSASPLGRAAALHGAELLRLGFSIDQVVHGYGDVCQSVMDLAIEEKTHITSDEFRTLNRCLDSAIADAVYVLWIGASGLEQ